MSETLNLTAILNAKGDAYAKGRKGFILPETFTVLPDCNVSTWDWFRSLGGRMVQVLYMCQDGTIRDINGRQGVHSSSQDGTVQNVGHAMASRDRLTLSFWTCTYGGRAVNTGAGKGYRTLRADRILAVRAEGETYVTPWALDLVRIAQQMS